MSKRIFGTDGVRGKVYKDKDKEEYDAELFLSQHICFNIFKSVVKVLGRGRYVICRDTRLSGVSIEGAAISSITSSGSELAICGVMPTPAVSLLVRNLNCRGGFSISASHNKPEYNGIKVFLSDGYKADDETEERIEKIIEENDKEVETDYSNILQFNAVDFYKSFILSKFRFSLKGLKVAVDCSNGANYKVAPEIFGEMGAKVFATGNNPDGKNINVNCGSENIENIRTFAEKVGADLGISFDGDGDRVIFVSRGKIIDGDDTLAFLFDKMVKNNTLKNGVVGTILSNYALEKFVVDKGAKFWRTPVGDKYVSYKMREVGANLGGEESGHITVSDFLGTGDGIITSLTVLRYLLESEKYLDELIPFVKFKQVKDNVKVKERKILEQTKIPDIVRNIEKDMGDGRIVVRYSGTEPVLRIMAECKDEEKSRRAVEKIKELIEREIGIK